MNIHQLNTLISKREFDLHDLCTSHYPEFQTMVREKHQMVIHQIMYAEWFRSFCNYLKAGAIFPPLTQVNELIYAAHKPELDHVKNYLLEARGEYHGTDQDAAEVFTTERYDCFQLF